MPDRIASEDAELLGVLESLRERGALGESSLEAAITHADAFVSAIPAGATHVLDLGSGGGLPGLVIAVHRPDLMITLVDRRERRMDLLRLACARLGITDRVAVVTGDVVQLGRHERFRGAFDVVTARAFGEPLWTLTCARPFLIPAGMVIVSEPPDTDTLVRWPSEAVAALGLHASADDFGRVRRFESTTPLPAP